jgi:hypothetical protein
MSKKGEDDDPWKRDVEKIVGAESGQYRERDSANNDGHRKQDLDITVERIKARKGNRNVAKNDGDRHVVPNSERGGWDVVKNNRERSSGHFETQKEAVDRARQIVDKTGGGDGEVVIHRKDGKIRDSDSGRRNESSAKDKR